MQFWNNLVNAGLNIPYKIHCIYDSEAVHSVLFWPPSTTVSETSNDFLFAQPFY